MLEKYTIQELESKNMTKGELFAELRKDTAHEFDYALPQDWLDAFSEFCKVNDPKITYHLILGTTVWVYPESAPLTRCTEVDKALDVYAVALANGWAR